MARLLRNRWHGQTEIAKGQKVKIQVDAYPRKNFEGKVIDKAYVGINRKNGSSNRFEVVILLENTKSILKPGMTTSNEITIQNYMDVISVPVKCVHMGRIEPYVYLLEEKRIVKREIKLGPSDGISIIIKYGVSEGDKLLFDIPNN